MLSISLSGPLNLAILTWGISKTKAYFGPSENIILFTSKTDYDMTEKFDFKELNKMFTGKRIRLLQMKDDPNPVPDGTEGTVLHIDDIGTIHVKWDNGRILGVIIGIDRYLIF